jgi:hypothetical protein
MRVPLARMRFTRINEGHPAKDGFVVLDLKGLDMEGVNTLVLDLADVDAVRKAGDKQEDARKRLHDLLGE